MGLGDRDILARTTDRTAPTISEALGYTPPLVDLGSLFDVHPSQVIDKILTPDLVAEVVSKDSYATHWEGVAGRSFDALFERGVVNKHGDIVKGFDGPDKLGEAVRELVDKERRGEILADGILAHEYLGEKEEYKKARAELEGVVEEALKPSSSTFRDLIKSRDKLGCVIETGEDVSRQFEAADRCFSALKGSLKKGSGLFGLGKPKIEEPLGKLNDTLSTLSFDFAGFQSLLRTCGLGTSDNSLIEFVANVDQLPRQTSVDEAFSIEQIIDSNRTWANLALNLVRELHSGLVSEARGYVNDVIAKAKERVQ